MSTEIQTELIDCLVDVRLIAKAQHQAVLAAAAAEAMKNQYMEMEAEPHGENLSYVRRNWGWQSTRKLVSSGNGHYAIRDWIKPLQNNPHNSKNRAQWERSGKAARRLTNRARRRAGLI